jgi:hypothetical protein
MSAPTQTEPDKDRQFTAHEVLVATSFGALAGVIAAAIATL